MFWDLNANLYRQTTLFISSVLQFVTCLFINTITSDFDNILMTFYQYFKLTYVT